MTPRVRIERKNDGRLAHAILARADRNNAIDLAFVESLDEGCQELSSLAHSGAIDCVLVTAEGGNFCVGGDLQDFPRDTSVTTSHIQKMAGLAHRATDLLHRLPIPVVAGVQGAVAGAGIGLTLCADLVVASQSARFTMAYAAVGLSPDGGTSWSLPRTIGLRRAMDLALTNRTLSAAEAEDWGLVSRVVPDHELNAELDTLVEGLLRLPTEVLVANKRLIRDSVHNGLTAQLADEAQSIAQLAARPFAQDLMAKFLARSTKN